MFLENLLNGPCGCFLDFSFLIMSWLLWLPAPILDQMFKHVTMCNNVLSHFQFNITISLVSIGQLYFCPAPSTHSSLLFPFYLADFKPQSPSYFTSTAEPSAPTSITKNTSATNQCSPLEQTGSSMAPLALWPSHLWSPTDRFIISRIAFRDTLHHSSNSAFLANTFFNPVIPTIP